MFYQDFVKSEHKSSPFYDDLIQLLREMGAEVIVDKLHGYDYSKAIGTLVSSVPGGHVNEKYGQNRLRSIVNKMDLNLKNATVTYQTSSLGALSIPFVESMYQSATRHSHVDGRLKILFPSTQTVFDNILGKESGNTIRFSEKYWLKPTFPRQVIHDCRSNASGLMHSKIMICTTTQETHTCIDIHAAPENRNGYIFCGYL